MVAAFFLLLLSEGATFVVLKMHLLRPVSPPVDYEQLVETRSQVQHSHRGRGQDGGGGDLRLQGLDDPPHAGVVLWIFGKAPREDIAPVAVTHLGIGKDPLVVLHTLDAKEGSRIGVEGCDPKPKVLIRCGIPLTVISESVFTVFVVLEFAHIKPLISNHAFDAIVLPALEATDRPHKARFGRRSALPSPCERMVTIRISTVSGACAHAHKNRAPSQSPAISHRKSPDRQKSCRKGGRLFSLEIVARNRKSL